MHVARRVYIYLVSFIGLLVALNGAAALLQLLLRRLFDVVPPPYYYWPSEREQFSINAALLLVGGVVWGVHWWLAQRSVAPPNPAAVEERQSVLRKCMVFAVLFVAVWEVFFALRNLIVHLLADEAGSVKLDAADSLPIMFVWGLAWMYYWYVRSTDNLLTPEQQRAATVRRWYFYLVNYITLSVLAFNLSDLARYLWETFTAGKPLSFTWTEYGSTVPGPLANDLSMVVVSGVFWLAHWIPTQRLTAVSVDEQHSSLRKVYLYAVILQMAAVALASLSIFLYDLLRLFIGTNPVQTPGESALTAAGGPLLTAVAYGGFWAYHWLVIGRDAALVAEERPLQGSIRRLYYHLVALIGLAVMASGVASMFRTLFEWLMGGQVLTLSSQQWGDRISLFVTLIAVGGPVWFANWLHLQREALAPDGQDKRQSLLRRIYLYLVLFGSVVALLYSTTWVIYKLLLSVGQTFTGSDTSDLSLGLGAGIAAAALLAYHLAAMAGDQRAAAQFRLAASTEIAPPAAEHPEAARPFTTILVVQTRESAQIGEITAAIEGRLPADSHVDVLAAGDLTPAQLSAWLISRASTEVQIGQ